MNGLIVASKLCPSVNNSLWTYIHKNHKYFLIKILLSERDKTLIS